MSSAKFLLVLPTPIQECVKQPAAYSCCSCKGEYFYIQIFSLALYLLSVQAAERVPSALSNGTLTTSFYDTLPHLPAASPHFRSRGDNISTKVCGVIMVTLTRGTLAIMTRIFRLHFTDRRKNKERNPDGQKFCEENSWVLELALFDFIYHRKQK